MIITVVGTKGGSGKSTLACNFGVSGAVWGLRVLLIDADRQGSAAEFTQTHTHLLGRAGVDLVPMD